MNSKINFVADRVLKGRIYPSMAQHDARPYTQAWREFGQHWPYTTPLRLQEYFDTHGIEYSVTTVCQPWPEQAFYPVALGFFDFDIDYFALMPDAVTQGLQQQQITVLFCYHEGDNPQRIKRRLDSLCAEHGLPSQCYVFVSSNTAAKTMPGFVCFHDFELWYWQRNRTTSATVIHHEPRQRDFTCLNRLHRWWRATAVADLYSQGLLNNSYWSYCDSVSGEEDSPIEVDLIPQLRWRRDQWIKSLPHTCDDLTQDQRNDHSVTMTEFFSNAWCNIVLESQFDVDQSQGVFITEKTFKPIKHGQMFFVAGAAGSLQTLRDLGYRTFDHVLDNRYDRIENHTQRWLALRDAVAAAQPQLPELFEQARAEIEHNQNLFLASKTQRLNTLIGKIHEQHC